MRGPGAIITVDVVNCDGRIAFARISLEDLRVRVLNERRGHAASTVPRLSALEC
jgi:hypothetical protein